MAMDNRPRGREKHVTGTGKDIFRRGSGVGGGPVGGGSMNGRPSGSGSGGGVTRAGGKGSLIGIILAIVALLGGGGGILGSFLGGNSTPSAPTSITTPGQANLGGLSDLLGGLTSFSGSGTSSGWSSSANTGKLNRSVAAGAREKYTEILGSNKDQVTVMVYMCGTDLESKSGMASADLAEMASATLSDKVNVLVYTGGCKEWKTKGISNSVNQIYKIEKGGIKCLVKDDGAKAMTKPDTLSSFIKWCVKNYEANRYQLIFWDHGGGSVSGYGYDEKNTSSGSMTLSGINSAFKSLPSDLKFDFIGFDACLMATAENALMLSPYADYLIASEETEPGIGWYYTNWLTELSKNSSLPTIEIGKRIVDDFVDVCAQKCKGQKATLSVVDLAELAATVPSELTSFASSTSDLMKNNSYQTVSNARSGCREFAVSSKIDQVDLIHLANNMGTKEGKSLADALLSAVKYNRTSSDMTNAYGISIYFPYQKTSKVDTAVKTYEAIGMDDEYADCIKQFASLEVGGQAVSGGSSASSPFTSLLGSLMSGSAPSSPAISGTDAISSLLGSFLGGSVPSVPGLNSSNTGFLSGLLGMDKASEYLNANAFDASALVWTASGNDYVLKLSEEQWKLVTNLELNVFYDDGEGYLDLGLDTVFDFNKKGELLGTYDGTWLAIDQQPVAFYHVSTIDEGEKYTITGRVPVLLNGDRADLILVFDQDNPYGYVAGARFDYKDGETDTVAKEMTGLKDGDKIDFLCDYYTYSGKYQDSYMIGEQYIVNGTPKISNVYLPNAKNAVPSYRFTDIYNQNYWTPVIPG